MSPVPETLRDLDEAGIEYELRDGLAHILPETPVYDDARFRKAGTPFPGINRKSHAWALTPAGVVEGQGVVAHIGYFHYHFSIGHVEVYDRVPEESVVDLAQIVHGGYSLFRDREKLDNGTVVYVEGCGHGYGLMMVQGGCVAAMPNPSRYGCASCAIVFRSKDEYTFAVMSESRIEESDISQLRSVVSSFFQMTLNELRRDADKDIDFAAFNSQFADAILDRLRDAAHERSGGDVDHSDVLIEVIELGNEKDSGLFKISPANSAEETK